MPMYPAPMTALAPTTVPTRWQPVRISAAVLCFVGLVLVVASVFLPLYSGEVSIGGGLGSNTTIKLTFSPWDVEITPSQPDAGGIDVPHVGYPLVFAAVFLAGAACACWYAATPSAGRTSGRAAGVITATSSAFLIGTVWTTATMAANGVDYFITLGTLGQGLESDGSYLVGYWLLLTAVLLSFAAAVLSMLPARQPVWQPQVNPYMATPAYGIAMPPQAQPGQPVVYALPPEPVQGQPPAPQPLAVDPLTGQPFQPSGTDPMTGQPVAQGPASQPFHAPGIDPATGQPNVAAQPPAGTVDPLTGQPVPVPFASQANPPAAQHLGPVDPLTGQPLAPGLLSPPAGIPAPTATPVPFTPEPVGQVNGTHPTPAVQPPAAAEPPIVLPAAPPPETPPGPAIPASEDPLAEPPRTT